jgi:GT2 family glycosyltransferase
VSDVDVVIPTRDRPAQLSATLTALARQDCGEFGVVVVDDGGARPAQDLVSDTVFDRLTIRFLRNDVSIGPGQSRNRGVSASEAPYVVFLDDDCVAVPELIGRHRAALAGADGPVVSLGPILSPESQRLSVWNHWDADRLQREYARIRSGATVAGWRHLYTGNVGVRRVDFEAIRGFDRRFARQEDVELGYRLARLGSRFEFDPDAIVYHHSDRTLSAWRRIPAASARFDVLMDLLMPESARLAEVAAGQNEKHWAVRLTRRLARGSASRRCAVSAAIGVGRALHATRVDRAALGAYSVAWDLIYDEALRNAVDEREKVGAPG